MASGPGIAGAEGGGGTPVWIPAPPGTKRAQEYAAAGDWPGYFSVMDGKPARETLLAALAGFEREGVAPGLSLDLGCGEGRDTIELLRRGWRVVAVDSTPEAFGYLERKVSGDERSRLAPCVSALEAFEFPPARSVDLVNASFTLPFVNPGEFGRVWRGIATSLRAGGRFAGQFFGERDDWARAPGRSHHSRAEVEALLADFQLEMLDEVEKQEAPELGGAKHWHVFHVMARRRH
ncbi:MAG: class I SAM-dependent methyltransferase [Phycisphaerales bacterium]|nr:class I SAM-dependent methyltransferase [Phycisphaerales bacterium]